MQVFENSCKTSENRGRRSTKPTRRRAKVREGVFYGALARLPPTFKFLQEICRREIFLLSFMGHMCPIARVLTLVSAICPRIIDTAKQRQRHDLKLVVPFPTPGRSPLFATASRRLGRFSEIHHPPPLDEAGGALSSTTTMILFEFDRARLALPARTGRGRRRGR